jgi:hypothetical protein
VNPGVSPPISFCFALASTTDSTKSTFDRLAVPPPCPSVCPYLPASKGVCRKSIMTEGGSENRTAESLSSSSLSASTSSPPSHQHGAANRPIVGLSIPHLSSTCLRCSRRAPKGRRKRYVPGAFRLLMMRGGCCSRRNALGVPVVVLHAADLSSCCCPPIRQPTPPRHCTRPEWTGTTL